MSVSSSRQTLNDEHSAEEIAKRMRSLSVAVVPAALGTIATGWAGLGSGGGMCLVGLCSIVIACLVLHRFRTVAVLVQFTCCPCCCCGGGKYSNAYHLRNCTRLLCLSGTLFIIAPAIMGPMFLTLFPSMHRHNANCDRAGQMPDFNMSEQQEEKYWEEIWKEEEECESGAAIYVIQGVLLLVNVFMGGILIYILNYMCSDLTKFVTGEGPVGKNIQAVAPAQVVGVPVTDAKNDKGLE